MMHDKPTATLEGANSDRMIKRNERGLGNGAALIGIFLDEAVREAVATRFFEVSDFAVREPA